MRGTTSEEVELALGLSHQTVSARRSELRAWGYTTYLLNAGKYVIRPTQSGRNAYVEIVTTKGKNAITLNERIGDAADITRSRHKGNPMSSAAFNSGRRAQLRMTVLKEMNKYS